MRKVLLLLILFVVCLKVTGAVGVVSEPLKDGQIIVPNTTETHDYTFGIQNLDNVSRDVFITADSDLVNWSQKNVTVPPNKNKYDVSMVLHIPSNASVNDTFPVSWKVKEAKSVGEGMISYQPAYSRSFEVRITADRSNSTETVNSDMKLNSSSVTLIAVIILGGLAVYLFMPSEQSNNGEDDGEE